MFDNAKQEYKLYIELFCEKIRINYTVFSLIFVNYTWILILILDSSERGKYFFFLSKDLNFLPFISGFLTLIMIRKLRDISVEKFLDPEMPFYALNKNIKEHLYIIFSPYKVRRQKTRKNIKKYYFLYDHLYFALLISVAAGLIGFFIGNLDTYFGFLNDVLGSGLAVAQGWFLFSIMGHMIININVILKNLSKSVKNLNEIRYFSHILKIKELREIPLNILYSYAIIMISFPAFAKRMIFQNGPWIYANTFLFVGELLIFFIVLIIPNYYVHLIIETIKKDYKKQAVLLVENLENKIFEGKSTKSDLKRYEVFIGMIERVERITKWPLDYEDTAKIILTGLVGIVPSLIQFLS